MSRIDDILSKSVSNIDAEIDAATEETLEERYEFCIHITYDFLDYSFAMLKKRIEQLAEHSDIIFDYHFETNGPVKHELMYSNLSFYFNLTKKREAKDLWLFIYRLASIDDFSVARLPVMWKNNWTGTAIGTNKMFKKDIHSTSQVRVMLKMFLPKENFTEQYCTDLSRYAFQYPRVRMFRRSKQIRIPGILYNYNKDLFYTADNALEAWQKWIFIKEATSKYTEWHQPDLLIGPLDHFAEFLVRWCYDSSFAPSMNYLTGIYDFINHELTLNDIATGYHYGIGAIQFANTIRIDENGKITRL